jgi:hypothetical protein
MFRTLLLVINGRLTRARQMGFSMYPKPGYQSGHAPRDATRAASGFTTKVYHSYSPFCYLTCSFNLPTPLSMRFASATVSSPPTLTPSPRQKGLLPQDKRQLPQHVHETQNKPLEHGLESPLKLYKGPWIREVAFIMRCASCTTG